MVARVSSVLCVENSCRTCSSQSLDRNCWSIERLTLGGTLDRFFMCPGSASRSAQTQTGTLAPGGEPVKEFCSPRSHAASPRDQEIGKQPLTQALQLERIAFSVQLRSEGILATVMMKGDRRIRRKNPPRLRCRGGI